MNTFTATTFATTILASSLLSCSSAGTPAGVDFENQYRFAGTHDGVRVDAQIVGSAARLPFRLVYEVENQRENEIALVPDASIASYDSDNRTITVRLGAEIPESEQMLVARIRPGERRTFNVVAHAAPGGGGRGLLDAARFVRLQLTYLREVEPFGPVPEGDELERVQVSDTTLPVWLENNERLVTNALPLGGGTASQPAIGRVGSSAMYARPQNW